MTTRLSTLSTSPSNSLPPFPDAEPTGFKSYGLYAADSPQQPPFDAKHAPSTITVRDEDRGSWT
ncbi:hypothetical protein E4U59_007066 [Claviceps monticola]|nr:hypothetical protein E4U59_007066 [Claviceps monticola]